MDGVRWSKPDRVPRSSARRTPRLSYGASSPSVGVARWSDVRDVRPHQPVMSISSPPAIPVDRRVRRVTLDQWDAYTEAAVKMYTEEIGVSPVQGNPAGYRFYVRQLISSGRAFGIFDGNRVLFKADLGSVSGSVCQVQGVWLEAELRGQGLAAPAMAAVVRWRVRSFRPSRSTSTTTTSLRGRRTREWGSPRSANSRRFTFDRTTCPAGSSLDRSVDDLVRLRRCPSRRAIARRRRRLPPRRQH